MKLTIVTISSCVIALSLTSLQQPKEKVSALPPNQLNKEEVLSQTIIPVEEPDREVLSQIIIPVEEPANLEAPRREYPVNIPRQETPYIVPQETPATAKLSSPSGYKKGNSYMKLTPTGENNRLGNPLYRLSIFLEDGREITNFQVVTGRANTQTLNRQYPGTNAPLPDGQYQVAQRTVPGTIPEVGERFLAIQPLFSTARTALGFHYDPSYEKQNGEDGTSGCIGLKNREEFNQFLNYVRDYKPQLLIVQIER